MKHCSQCNAEGGPDDNFCENCGGDLVDGPAAAPAAALDHTDGRGAAAQTAAPTADAAPDSQPAEQQGEQLTEATTADAAPDSQPAEQPGEQLTEATKPCPGCGEMAPLKNGICSNCGEQVVKVLTPRDHIEVTPADDLAVISDIGPTHDCNQDCGTVLRVAVAGEPADVLIVLDGVSMAENSEVASENGCRAAAQAASDALIGTESDRQALTAAIDAAQPEVLAIPYVPHPILRPATATFVAAIARKNSVEVGWLGDSRAYLIFPDSVKQLTRDHSWLNDVRDFGMSEKEIAEKLEEEPQLEHAIVRCLGPLDEGETLDPEFNRFDSTGALCLLVVTDGFWNHLDDPEVLGKLVRQALKDCDGNASKVAALLVENANTEDGHDNVTVAVRIFNNNA